MYNCLHLNLQGLTWLPLRASFTTQRRPKPRVLSAVSHRKTRRELGNTEGVTKVTSRTSHTAKLHFRVLNILFTSQTSCKQTGTARLIFTTYFGGTINKIKLKRTDLSTYLEHMYKITDTMILLYNKTPVTTL